MEVFLVVTSIILLVIRVLLGVGIATGLLYPAVIYFSILLVQDLNKTGDLLTNWEASSISTMYIVAYIILAISFIPFLTKLKRIIYMLFAMIYSFFSKIFSIFHKLYKFIFKGGEETEY